MKSIVTSITLFVLFFLCLSSANAQFLNYEDAVKLKNSHVILGLTDNEEVNEIFRNAVKNFWTLTEIKEELPVKDAIAKIKDDKSVTVIMLGRDVTTNWSDLGNGWQSITSASGLYIGLNTKGNKGANLMQHTSGWSEVQLLFGLTTIQDAISSIIDNNLSGMAKVKDVYDKRSPNLKNYTLLIDKSTMDSKLTESIIKENYSHPFQIVSHEEWEEAIFERKEGFAYINIIPVPVGDQIAHLGYVIACSELEAFMYFRTKEDELTSKDVASIMKETVVK